MVGFQQTQKYLSIAQFYFRANIDIGTVQPIDSSTTIHSEEDMKYI
jgi:hypothetical protein